MPLNTPSPNIPTNWLTERLPPLKQHAQRWEDLCLTIQEYYAAYAEPAIERIVDLRSIFTAESIADKKEILTDLGWFFSRESNEKSLDEAYRDRLYEVSRKGTTAIVNGTIARAGISDKVRWVILNYFGTVDSYNAAGKIVQRGVESGGVKTPPGGTTFVTSITTVPLAIRPSSMFSIVPGTSNKAETGTYLMPTPVDIDYDGSGSYSMLRFIEPTWIDSVMAIRSNGHNMARIRFPSKSAFSVSQTVNLTAEITYAYPSQPSSLGTHDSGIPFAFDTDYWVRKDNGNVYSSESSPTAFMVHSGDIRQFNAIMVFQDSGKLIPYYNPMVKRLPSYITYSASDTSLTATFGGVTTTPSTTGSGPIIPKTGATAQKEGYIETTHGVLVINVADGVPDDVYNRINELILGVLPAQIVYDGLRFEIAETISAISAIA